MISGLSFYARHPFWMFYRQQKDQGQFRLEGMITDNYQPQSTIIYNAFGLCEPRALIKESLFHKSLYSTIKMTFKQVASLACHSRREMTL